MSTRARPLIVPSLMLLLAGCVGVSGNRYRTEAPSGTAATVLRAEHLTRSVNLVQAIAARLPGAQIASGGRNCPEITLRGRKSIRGDNNPAVYVDGARAANTCVLDMLAVTDVDRVEVYPLGLSPSLTYRGHPNGLILVFLTDGRQR